MRCPPALRSIPAVRRSSFHSRPDVLFHPENAFLKKVFLPNEPNFGKLPALSLLASLCCTIELQLSCLYALNLCDHFA